MEQRGLYGKYEIRKTNGEELDPKAVYFVLRIDTDPYARVALRTYIETCRAENPELAEDLDELMLKLETERPLGKATR